MADNLTTTTSLPSGLPNSSVLATKDLGGGVHASKVVVTSTDGTFPLGTIGDAADTAGAGTSTGLSFWRGMVQQLASLLAKFGTVVPQDSDSALPVREMPTDLYRAAFSDVIASVTAGTTTSDNLVVKAVGSGMALSQASSALVLTTGTTANSEMLARSTRTFRGAHTLRARVTLSQRIANNNFEIALADLIGESLAVSVTNATTIVVTFPSVNPWTSANVGQGVNVSVISGVAGIPMRATIASVSGLTVTLTVAGWPASGSGTLTLWGWNYHRILYTSTTATQCAYDGQSNGWNSGDTTATINTTASPGHLVQIQSSDNDAALSDALVATATATQFTQRASRVEKIPNMGQTLYLFVRAYNGTTNPATTTTWTIGHINVEVVGRNKVRIASADQGAPGMSALPVQIAANAAAPLFGSINFNQSLPAGTNAIGALTATTALIGDVGIEYRANATGAATVLPIFSAATVNNTNVKASAGRLLGYHLHNTTGAAKYFKLFNTSSTPAAGTTTEVATIGIPPNLAVTIAFDGGLAFTTGISFAITGQAAHSDTTAVASGDVVGYLAYV